MANSREQRARQAAEVIRSAREYRWVGIYAPNQRWSAGDGEVASGEVAAIGWTGPDPSGRPALPPRRAACAARRSLPASR